MHRANIHDGPSARIIVTLSMSQGRVSQSAVTARHRPHQEFRNRLMFGVPNNPEAAAFLSHAMKAHGSYSISRDLLCTRTLSDEALGHKRLARASDDVRVDIRGFSGIDPPPKRTPSIWHL